MSDLIDRISDADDAEKTRVAAVGSHNNIIFGGLTTAVKDRCSRYNERHPPERWARNTLIANEEWVSSTAFSLHMQKTTAPVSSLKVDFPINSGAMQFSVSNGERGSIRLDITDDDKPIFDINGAAHSVDEAADFLVSLLLSETPPSPKKKIGFIPV